MGFHCVVLNDDNQGLGSAGFTVGAVLVLANDGGIKIGHEIHVS